MPDGSLPDAELGRPKWRKSAFLLSHIVAGLLIFSWLLPPTRNWWAALDEKTFRLFNGILVDAPGQQYFWALANNRSVDLVSGSLAVLVFIWWIWGNPRAVQNWRCAVFAALTIPAIILPFVAHEVLERVFLFERPSPTIVYEDAQRLTQLVPEMETKDASRYSFPGDHAFVLFSILFFYVYFNARKCVLISILMAVIFMLPRLVAGAHWLSDNIVGGAAPALLITAWVLATPFSYYFARILLPIVNLVIGLMPSWLQIPESRSRS